MLTTNILLLLIFVNIILFLMPLPALHGILSSISGISIYLLPILLWLINIQNSVQPHELLPSCMQRSYLLSIDFKVTSLTEWAVQLKMNPLYAILSGFEVGNTPGVGTFYDFLNRLWDSDDGCISCTCESPCSNAKYGRTIHLVLKDNPRLFNNPPRSSKKWKLEYNARTSAERSNKRERLDFKLEDGRHRSTKMWYCRLYHILMLQHLDAWDLPPESPLKKLILDVA